MWSPNPWAGLAFVFLTVFFFKIVSRVCAKLIKIPSGVYRGRDDEYRVFKWRNLVISLIHSAITGCWSMTCMIMYGKFILADLVLYANWPMYLMSCFSVGYFIYDALDIIIGGHITRKWEILLHHFALLTVSPYAVVYVECVGYQTVAMLVEVNTVFLHGRQLFRLADRASRTDPLVRANMYANLVTFVAFRIFPLARVSLGLFYDGHRIHYLYLRFISTSIFFINIINVVLLYRLIRADIFSVERSVDRQEKVDSVNGKDIIKEVNDSMEVPGPGEGDGLHSKNGLRLRGDVNSITKHLAQANVQA